MFINITPFYRLIIIVTACCLFCVVFFVLRKKIFFKKDTIITLSCSESSFEVTLNKTTFGEIKQKTFDCIQKIYLKTDQYELHHDEVYAYFENKKTNHKQFLCYIPDSVIITQRFIDIYGTIVEFMISLKNNIFIETDDGFIEIPFKVNQITFKKIKEIYARAILKSDDEETISRIHFSSPNDIEAKEITDETIVTQEFINSFGTKIIAKNKDIITKS